MWFTSIQTQLLECLGEGSQGSVFKALRIDRKTGLSHTVAIKILHSGTAVELWGKEFRSLQRVRSPYCVPVLSFERVTGRPALVLEYVEGLSLAEIARANFLEPDDITEIIAQIEAGLLDLHAQKSCHGDLSPANVMIDVEGHVRLLDFGLANGVGLRGTPEFTAPERFAGVDAGLRTDLFALGRLDQFLRGKDLRSTDGLGEYLNFDPHRRHARSLRPQATQQREVARKLQIFLQRRRIAAEVVTRPLLIPEISGKISRWRQRAWIAGLIMTCACLGSTRATQTAPPTRTGELRVRTKAWYRIELDGVLVGYPPLNLGTVPGTHVLRYTGHKTRGQIQVTVTAGHTTNLGDRDFSH